MPVTTEREKTFKRAIDTMRYWQIYTYNIIFGYDKYYK